MIIVYISNIIEIAAILPLCLIFSFSAERSRSAEATATISVRVSILKLIDISFFFNFVSQIFEYILDFFINVLKLLLHDHVIASVFFYSTPEFASKFHVSTKCQ